MISKINISFFFFLCFIISHKVFSQKKIEIELHRLYKQQKINELRDYTKKRLKSQIINSSEDSLLYSKLMFYKYQSEKKTKNYNILDSLKKIILYCPKNNSGDSLKSIIFNIKAYYHSNTGSIAKSHQSILKSLDFLQNIPNTNPGYKMGAYLLLSTHYIYYGNKKKAVNSLSLAEEIYAKNKPYIDNNTWELNGNNHRMIVIAKYRKMYLLYKLAEEADKEKLLQTMQELEDLHSESEFHEEERIYYTTALSHIGDWFISHKHDSLTTQEDVKKGLHFLLKTQKLIEEKGYSGTPWTIKYNIAKGFIRGNQLEKADSVMFNLMDKLSENDSRLPFFLAQIALIKAKKNQRDSALFLFEKSIRKIHLGKENLKKDFSNFKPSSSYNHTKLLLRIAEELEYHFKKDTIATKKVSRLYLLALQQLQNSYLKSSFNNQQNEQIKKIIHGILKYRNTGFIDDKLQPKKSLNIYETIKGKLAWKRFYENRFTNALPELDSINELNFSLNTLLTKAKLKKNLITQDSINAEIKKLKDYEKKLYPQIELLSNFSFSIDDLQRNLKEHQLILKYIIVNQEIAIYQISKTSFKVDLIPFDLNNQSAIKRFVKNVRENDLYESENIAKTILPKIDDKFTHLIINPDSFLFKIPFEILRLNNQYLIENYDISYTSNLGFITNKPAKSKINKRLHIYVPTYDNTNSKDMVRSNISYLNGAKEEAKIIKELFPSKLYIDQKITKVKFLETASNAKILHLAMHAEVDESNPEFSRLLLSSNVKNEEEQLYLEELYNAKLGADLAILSACNTGNGKEESGVLASFQRAFMFAGVPSTVASLWEVPDSSTQEIMVSFYKNLKKGLTKSEALKNAKIEYLVKYEGSRLAHPYFWAGFVIYGNNSAIINQNYNLHILIGILALTLIFFLIKRRKSFSL